MYTEFLNHSLCTILPVFYSSHVLEKAHEGPARMSAALSSSAAFPNPGSNLLQKRGIGDGVNGKHLANTWRVCLAIIDFSSLKHY